MVVVMIVVFFIVMISIAPMMFYYIYSVYVRNPDKSPAVVGKVKQSVSWLRRKTCKRSVLMKPEPFGDPEIHLQRMECQTNINEHIRQYLGIIIHFQSFACLI